MHHTNEPKIPTWTRHPSCPTAPLPPAYSSPPPSTPPVYPAQTVSSLNPATTPPRPQIEFWAGLSASMPAGTDKASETLRKKLFKQFDSQGNGYLSLAEVSTGIAGDGRTNHARWE